MKQAAKDEIIRAPVQAICSKFSAQLLHSKTMQISHIMSNNRVLPRQVET